MVELTTNTLGNSLVIMFIGYGIALAFQIYMLYLNWKQSRVKNQMGELIDETREIKNLLSNMQKES